jgi:hypothetical protein
MENSVVSREGVGFQTGARHWYRAVGKSRNARAAWVCSEDDVLCQQASDNDAPLFDVRSHQYTMIRETDSHHQRIQSAQHLTMGSKVRHVDSHSQEK